MDDYLTHISVTNFIHIYWFTQLLIFFRIVSFNPSSFVGHCNCNFSNNSHALKTSADILLFIKLKQLSLNTSVQLKALYKKYHSQSQQTTV